MNLNNAESSVIRLLFVVVYKLHKVPLFAARFSIYYVSVQKWPGFVQVSYFDDWWQPWNGS